MSWGKNERAPKASLTFHKRKYGIAYKTRVSWQRNPHSTQMIGVMPDTRGRGSPRRRARACLIGGKQGRYREVKRKRRHA